MTEKEYITQLENKCHSMAGNIITRLCSPEHIRKEKKSKEIRIVEGKK